MKMGEGMETIIPGTSVLLLSFILKEYPYIREQTNLFSIGTVTDIHNSKFYSPVNHLLIIIAPAKYASTSFLHQFPFILFYSGYNYM